MVELATGSFPYKDCHTDFEVLTRVLEADPPSLPTDEGFSDEFQTFVRKWFVSTIVYERCENPMAKFTIIYFIFSLTKDVKLRPKYPELLESDYLKNYENANIDVAAWFALVMETKIESNR